MTDMTDKTDATKNETMKQTEEAAPESAEQTPATEQDPGETVNAARTDIPDDGGKDEKPGKTERRARKMFGKADGELAAAIKRAEALEAALAEEKESRMRLAAEYENFRRRSKAEKDGIYADAYADAILSILPIIDNLERAEGFESAEDVKKGVQMILSSAREALSKMGVEEIEATGVAFDPNVHNAVMHTEDESLGENMITAVFQKGYRRGDRIIRYAMVSVAN